MRKNRAAAAGAGGATRTVLRRAQIVAAQHASAVSPAQQGLDPQGPNGPSQHRDHRARRSRQDHAGRRAAQAGRRLPPQPEGGGPGHGQQRPGARARHHHPGQVHVDPLARHAHQHRRHARPRRLRRRGGAHPQHGRRRHRAGGCLRGTAAADQVRGLQGAQAGPAPHRGHQQDRPAGRAPQRGAERDLRPVRQPRRQRRAARLPRALRLGPRRLDGGRSRGPEDRPGAAVRAGAQARAAAGGGGGSLPPARHHAGGRSLPRARADGPHQLGQRQAQPDHQGHAPRRLADRDGARHQGAGLPRPGAHGRRSRRGRRHRRHRRHHPGDGRRHAVRSQRREGRFSPSRSTRRRSP